MNTHLNPHSTYPPHSSTPLCDDHKHLTENQIDDHLIGDLAAAPSAHLAACYFCSARIAAAEDTLAGFQSITVAWSERRAATLPLPDLSLQKPLWQHPMASVAVCFALVIGMAITNASRQVVVQTTAPQTLPQETAHLESAQLQPAQPAAVPIETASLTIIPRASQIAADNHMLKAIDAELDTTADSPSDLGILTTSQPASAPSTIPSVQD